MAPLPGVSTKHVAISLQLLSLLKFVFCEHDEPRITAPRKYTESS